MGMIDWLFRKNQKTNNEPRIIDAPDNSPKIDITCPHCAHHFEKMPSRKRKCPACREWIWPKRPPGSTHKRLVSVEQAEVWEAEWEKVSERRAIEKAPESYAKNAGYWGGETAERAFRKNFPSAHAKVKERHGDTKRAVDIAAREAMGHPESSAYQQKLLALDDAWAASKTDGDYMKHLIKHHREQLREIKIDNSIGIHHVRIVALGSGGRFCPACKAMDGEIFKITDERKHMHLPVDGCTCTGLEDHQTGFCLCYYECVFDDEV